MSVIHIQTTQNVTIDYQLAGLGNRIVAFLIDLLVLAAYCFLMVILLSIFGISSAFGGSAIVVFYIGFLILPVLFYDLICEVYFNGQSIGKKSMNIRVIRIDGSKPSIGSYLIRWATRLIEGIIVGYGIIPIVTIAVSEKGQRLGDIMAGTTVIKTNKKVKVFRNPLDLIQERENYEVKYPEVINLSDSDIRIIKEAVNTFRKNRRREPIDAVTRKVEDLLNVRNTDVPIEFLTRIVSDYNFLVLKDLS
ncbi:MAG: RDD family protein [Cyclobacteriaceae bacterium]